MIASATTAAAPPLQTNSNVQSQKNLQSIQQNVERKNSSDISDKKNADLHDDDDKIDEVDEKILLLDDPKNVLLLEQNSKQNKENVEINMKKSTRKNSTTAGSTDAESIKSKSESGENVCKFIIILHDRKNRTIFFFF